MSQDHHFDASTRPSPSLHTEDEHKVPQVPVSNADGHAERLTPNEWVDAWIEAGGSFNRDDEHFLVGRPIHGGIQHLRGAAQHLPELRCGHTSGRQDRLKL